MIRSPIRRSMFVLAVVGLLASSVAAPVVAKPPPGKGAPSDSAVLFASDGMRQDQVEKYAAQGLMPTMASFLKNGASATGEGLLTEAPPNTGAGWYSLATGAWPGVHGSTNNTFHINGSTFANSTSAFAPGILKAESIAQSAERGGLKVAQVEWAGGANATIQGPTIDFQSFFSGRGVSTNFIGKAGDALFDDAAFIAAFGLQFDTPAGYRRHGHPFPAAAPTDATGWSGNLPATYSPAKEMRLRVLDGTTDKYGLNAWIFDSTNDSKTNYDKVLFSTTKSAADAVATIGKGVFADVKVKIQGGALDGKTAGMLVRVEELTPDLSRVRLFHTSVSRAIATWPTWPGEPGFTGDFAEYLAQTFPTSTAADFAILEAGVTSEETYAEQGLYWATGHQPMLKYVMNTYHPDLLLAGVPTTDEFQHQFLGLVSTKLPNGAANPAYDDVDLNGVPDGRVAQREAFIRTAYEEADETLTLARDLAGGNPVTFVSSDHGFAPQFLAIDASKPLVDLGLLSQAPDVELPHGGGGDDRVRPRPAGPAAPSRSTSTSSAAIRSTSRRPRRSSRSRRPTSTRPSTKIRDAFKGARRSQRLDPRRQARGLEGHRPDLHQGRVALHPERPRQHRRHGQSHADGRPRRVRLPAVPVRCRDAGHADRPVPLLRPARLRAGRPEPRPTTSTCGRPSSPAAPASPRARSPRGRSTSHRPSSYILGIPEPQQSQGRVLTELLKGGNSIKPISIVGLNDFHGQLDPTTVIGDNNINVPVGGAVVPGDDVRRGARRRCPGPGSSWPAATTSAPRRRTPALLDDMPTIDVENAWGLDATSYGNHEFDYGVDRLSRPSSSERTSRSWPRTSSRRRPASSRRG